MNTSENKRPLRDQTALVTHATTGIGGAIAKALANAGAKVMINYLDERDKAEQLAEQIRDNQGQAMIFRADVNLENEVKSMLDVLIAYWGRLDILVKNTGFHEKTVGRLANQPPSNVDCKIVCVSPPDIDSREDLIKLMDILRRELSEENIRLDCILAEKNKPLNLKHLSIPEQGLALSNFISDGEDRNAYSIAKMAVWRVSNEADSRDGEILI